jgi:hypothetical protein
MAVFEGIGGTVKLNTAESAVAELLGVKRWRIRDESDKEDVTMMGQGNAWKAYAATLKGAAVTIEAFADTAEAKWLGAPPVIYAGASLDVELSFDEATAEYDYTGEVLVDSVEAELSREGILNLTVEGTVNGELTYPTTPT